MNMVRLLLFKSYVRFFVRSSRSYNFNALERRQFPVNYNPKGAMLQNLCFHVSLESQLVNLLLNHKTIESCCTCRLKTKYNRNSNTEIDMSFNRVIFV